MQNIQKLIFSVAYCPVFSGISAVVLILLLGACESEQFPTAEHNKSQKQNIKLCIHGFYFTKFCLHFHFPTFSPQLNVCIQMLSQSLSESPYSAMSLIFVNLIAPVVLFGRNSFAFTFSFFLSLSCCFDLILYPLQCSSRGYSSWISLPK